MPITFIFFLFQWNLITFNCAVLFSNSMFIFLTKAHPPCKDYLVVISMILLPEKDNAQMLMFLWKDNALVQKLWKAKFNCRDGGNIQNESDLDKMSLPVDIAVCFFRLLHSKRAVPVVRITPFSTLEAKKPVLARHL